MCVLETSLRVRQKLVVFQRNYHPIDDLIYIYGCISTVTGGVYVVKLHWQVQWVISSCYCNIIKTGIQHLHQNADLLYMVRDRSVCQWFQVVEPFVS